MPQPLTEKRRARQLLFLPRINSDTFLLFYQKGENQMSWSLRNYREPGKVELRYAHEFGIEAAEILASATHRFGAPVIPATDLNFWHRVVTECNRRHDLTGTKTATTSFPVLAEPELRAHSKAAKAQDMRRIWHSPNSEDWVSWNFLQMMQRSLPENWWLALTKAASRFNPESALDWAKTDKPSLIFWRKVAPPAEYEH